MPDFTYDGLTHSCEDPDCHVAGFISTLERLQAEREVRDA